jgi:long-chain acyl-CoA synthetase
MSDLILGNDWVGEVHQTGGERFGVASAGPATIVGALVRHARAIPDAPFMTDAGAGAPALAFAAAHRAVQCRAGWLLRLGLQRGDRVGILGRNSIEFVLAVLATLEAGGVAVPLSPTDPAARIASHVEFTEARILLFDADTEPLAQACRGVERACSFSEIVAPMSEHPAGIAPPRSTDAALIFFTSGTTGAPKAVVQSHRAVAQNAFSLAAHHPVSPVTRLLCVLPLHHVNGLEFTIFSALLGGGHTFIERGFDPLRFWKTVRDFGIHIVSLVPNLLRVLAERPGLRGEEPVALRYAVSAAAPLSTAIAQRVRDRLGLRIVQGYGLSEVTNFSCLMPAESCDGEYERWMLGGRRTSVGSALPWQEVEIWTDDGIASPEVEGEIIIRGHCVMSGYLHNAAATAEAFRGGWFHTGDLGYWLPDGTGRKFIHVSGRVREIAKRSGEMVSLLELDEILASIPGVVDAAAVAFANTWVDEEIAAVVVREAGNTLTEEDIAGRCRGLLSFSAMPKAIKFVEKIPRTASGKICRHVIVEYFEGLREQLFTENNNASRDCGAEAQARRTAKGER